MSSANGSPPVWSDELRFALLHLEKLHASKVEADAVRERLRARWGNAARFRMTEAVVADELERVRASGPPPAKATASRAEAERVTLERRKVVGAPAGECLSCADGGRKKDCPSPETCIHGFHYRRGRAWRRENPEYGRSSSAKEHPWTPAR